MSPAVAISDPSGRLIDRVRANDAGRWLWEPARALPTGVYFARVEGTASVTPRFLVLH